MSTHLGAPLILRQRPSLYGRHRLRTAKGAIPSRPQVKLKLPRRYKPNVRPKVEKSRRLHVQNLNIVPSPRVYLSVCFQRTNACFIVWPILSKNRNVKGMQGVREGLPDRFLCDTSLQRIKHAGCYGACESCFPQVWHCSSAAQNFSHPHSHICMMQKPRGSQQIDLHATPKMAESPAGRHLLPLPAWPWPKSRCKRLVHSCWTLLPWPGLPE